MAGTAASKLKVKNYFPGMLAGSQIPQSPPLLRISCDLYHEMIRNGSLKEDNKIELIDGYLFTKVSIGSLHRAVVSKLERFLHRILKDDVIVRGQNPITIHEYSEPEPDVVVAKYRGDFYANRHPYPEDVALVIEVADTSLSFDREAKVPLYASCGIQETWLVDLNAKDVTAYRKPDGARYTEKAVFRSGDTLPVPGTGGASLAVAELGL